MCALSLFGVIERAIARSTQLLDEERGTLTATSRHPPKGIDHEADEAPNPRIARVEGPRGRRPSAPDRGLVTATKDLVTVTRRPSNEGRRPSAADKGLVMATKGLVTVTRRPSNEGRRPSAADKGLVTATKGLVTVTRRPSNEGGRPSAAGKCPPAPRRPPYSANVIPFCTAGRAAIAFIQRFTCVAPSIARGCASSAAANHG
jgi:hypothetical protein